jgi:hypothetical protein
MLLKNRKNESVNLNYLHEVKLQIEAMIELCREGEISVFDAENIITGEWFNATGLKDELTQDIDDLRQSKNHRMMDVAIIQEEIAHVQKMLDILEEYIVVLEDDKLLSEILLSEDYKLKRKAKIKMKNNIEYADNGSHETKEQEEKQTKENDTPEDVQQKIGETIALLMRKGLVKKYKDKYLMTDDSTVPKIITTLKVQIMLGKITVPATDDIGSFIVAYIRDKEGTCILKDTVEKALNRKPKSRQKRIFPDK